MRFPRIETIDLASFITSKTVNSRLWFVNNPELEKAILGRIAKCQARYKVIIYAVAIQGNHLHLVALFPDGNRAFFMRDLNSAIAKDVKRYQEGFEGGPLFRDVYSSEIIPTNNDLSERYFYTVLQPVNDALVDDVADCPYYNCFEDSIKGRKIEYKVVRWKDYHDAKRWKKNADVTVDKFTDIFYLEFTRLPGYEHLSQEDYETTMRKELAERTKEVLETRRVKVCLGAKQLKQVEPGSKPKNPKTSTRTTERPRIASKNSEVIKAAMDWYWSIINAYKEASKDYRNGNLNAEFPKGTYRPPLFTVVRSGKDILGSLP